MGKWIHKIVDGVCVECGPGVLVLRPAGPGKPKRLKCRNSSSVTTGRYNSVQRLALVAELGREHTGVCESCGDTFTSTPHVDHDHVTGKARGYLCASCNLLLGHAKDDPERLQKAILYLKRFI